MIENSVNEIKGVGPKKEKCLEKLNIKTIKDLIYYLPRRYQDRRYPIPISHTIIGKENYVEATVVNVRMSFNRNKRNSTVHITVKDQSGALEVVFFKGNYLENIFQRGSKYSFYGKVTINNDRKEMVHPDFNNIDDETKMPGILPVYPLTEGLSQKDFVKFQLCLREYYEELEEWLPDQIVKENRLCDIKYAFENVHFPIDETAFKQSKFRIIFDELFAFEMGMFILKNNSLTKNKGIAFTSEPIEKEFIKSLDFDFTPGQNRVWAEINKDLCSCKQMNRLVQGDVGSGKTAIAETALYKAVKSGFQGVFMAPTEILAKQHFYTLKTDFESFDINVELLCSSVTNSKKKEILEDLEGGKIDILIGTHALIEPGVVFKNLGMVITDEQHRFGVNQRNILINKGVGTNILIMTATPIPRTLGIILYGDVDISIIDTMPVGRKPIITAGYNSKKRKEAYMLAKEQIELGHQCYVVAPLIEESDKIDAYSAFELYDELTVKLSDYKVGLIHGNLSQTEKDKIMSQFISGKINILVSTVVIEVGVNVPNATVMIIENSERFGLAQMHQLRGRVGRSSDQSYCFLITKNESDIAKERSKILVETNDGFEIAEEDLKLRGPGDFFGTKQHGLPDLRYADLAKHYQLLSNIKPQVNKILIEDPLLKKIENKGIKERVSWMFGDNLTINL